MQKKSFLIKDILQKLNGDELMHKNGQNCSKLTNDKQDDLEKSLKKIPTIDSTQLLYDWQSFAMAAMTQNNALIASKSMFTWNSFLNHNLPEELNYLSEQSKLKNYFSFNKIRFDSLQASSESINHRKRKCDHDAISENSNSSLCESSKFSDSESNVDVRSETSSLISIENTEDETNRTVKNVKNKGAKEMNEKKKRKNRRNRTVFTELQLMGLERRFDSQKYLSTPDRAELANALGLSQLQVKTWYQNRRMKWKKQVMQNGCLVAPTKPKGRPKKGTIPSLGLTFDTSTLLSAMESRKNSSLINKEMNQKMNTNLFLGRKNSIDLPLNSVREVNMSNLTNMNSMLNGQELSDITTISQQPVNQAAAHLQNEINQQFFNSGKMNNFVAKKTKINSFLNDLESRI